MSSKSGVATADKASGNRSRRADIDCAIDAAVRKILVEGGYDALNFDAIAREAGVSRPTLYRRWPNKAKLLEDFIFTGEYEFPSSVGSSGLRTAISEILHRVADHYMSPWMRAATLGVMASDVSRDAFPSGVVRRAETTSRAALTALLNDAVEKGLVREDFDPEAFFDLVIGPILHRAIFSSEQSLDERYLDSLLEMILHGLSSTSYADGPGKARLHIPER